MSLITRFNGAFKAFASDATGTFRTVFGDTTQSDDLTDNLTSDFKKGWEIVGTNDEPTIEDFNAMGYTLSQVLAYIHQVGIIEWSGTDGVVGGQDYYAGISFVGYDGDIYLAILDSGGSIEARVPTNATYWKKVSSAGLDINGQTNKPTPEDTDNLVLQEVGGDLKKLSWLNLKATLFDGDISLTENGYIKLPTEMGGLIIQWGTTGTIAQNATILVTLPVAFPTAFLNASVSYAADPGINTIAALSALKTSLSQMSITKGNNGGGAEDLLTTQWIAIGY